VIFGGGAGTEWFMSGESGRYTHGHHAAVLRSHASRTATNSAAYLLPRLRPGLSLLDVGCGPGTITADLAELVAPGPVTAMDAAEAALPPARQVAIDRGLTNITFGVADVHRLEYADDSFDVVHAHQVLQHVADPVLALREMRRVVKPGGVVAVRDAIYSAMTWSPETPELDQWLSIYQRVARRNGGEPNAGSRLLGWAQQAGFTDLTPSAGIWCYATPEDRALWAETWSARVRDSALAEQAVAYGLAQHPELTEIAEGWLRWSANPDGWFAVPHGELLCVK
jgi:ubiquinone/menaquinone biosynthesis C-methylase UbiE